VRKFEGKKKKKKKKSKKKNTEKVIQKFRTTIKEIQGETQKRDKAVKTVGMQEELNQGHFFADVSERGCAQCRHVIGSVRSTG
jgi:hypothetical protein